MTVESVDKFLNLWTAALRPNMARHFARWPELRKRIGSNPCLYDAPTNSHKQDTKFKQPGVPDPICGSPGSSPEEFFDYEVRSLREWTGVRLEWLDKNSPGTCS